MKPALKFLKIKEAPPSPRLVGAIIGYRHLLNFQFSRGAYWMWGLKRCWTLNRIFMVSQEQKKLLK